MKNMFFLVPVLLLSGKLYADAAFDLKTYERSLKTDIPWSLTGTAQNLRADAKHELELILRTFILLRPDALWTEEQLPPAAAQIPASFKALNDYLALPGNEAKRGWVIDSIDYIVNTYIPEVQKMLDSANAATLPVALSGILDKKRLLLQEFSKSISASRKEFGFDSNRMV